MNPDKDILGQKIRFHAHCIDVLTRCAHNENNGLQSHYTNLKKLLSVWKEQFSKQKDNTEWASHQLERCEEYIEHKKPFYYVFVESEKDRDIFFVMKERCTVRFWRPEMIDKKILKEIILAGMQAPTAFNRQAWKFIVIDNKLEEMVSGDTSNASMLTKAPHLIYIAIDQRLSEEKYAPAMDAALAAGNMLNAAHALGIGCCLMYRAELIDQQEFRIKNGLEEYHYIYAVIALGYSDETPAKPARADLDDVVIWG